MVVAVTVVLLVPLGIHVAGGDEESAPPAAPFFGLDVPQADVGHVDRLTQLLGCAPTVMNRFVKLNSEIDADTVAGLARGGRTPMVSLEPWTWQMRPGETWAPGYSLDSLTRGDHDEALRSIARTLATHHGPVLIRFAHEMNADWYPWGVVVNGNTAAGYVAAWKHVHDLMTTVAPNLRWVWSPLAAWWPNALPLASVYPGDAYVDYVGASGYGHGDTARATFGRWYAEVRDLTDRPALLSETGADGDRKTDWIASLVPFLQEHRDIRGFVWYNTSPATTGATGDYRIDDTPAHLNAFRDALRALGTPCSTSSTSSTSSTPNDNAEGASS